MQRFMCELSDELGAAIDAALAGRHRNPTLEAWLWRIREIQDAAKKLGVSKPVRRGRGRPRKEHGRLAGKRNSEREKGIS